MWEFTIVFLSEFIAKNFEKQIKNRIKEANGIVTVLATNNEAKVLVAVSLKHKNSVKKFLQEKIAENILANYKKEYILSRLTFNKETNSKMQVFLKALVCFDSDSDKDIILDKLDFEKTLIIESFINFKLKILKRKWDEVVNLANDNAIYLTSEDTFNELLKFLISNLEFRSYIVNIFSKQDCYFLCDNLGKDIDDFLIDNNIVYDDNILLTTLIALNPEKIVIHCNSFVKDKLIKDLYEYFSNRVEVCK